jgi:hypothetical protein
VACLADNWPWLVVTFTAGAVFLVGVFVGAFYVLPLPLPRSGDME